MNDREQIDAFVSTAAAIGVLAIKQHELIAHALNSEDEE